MATIYYTATTLDGFLADEHDNLDWLLKQPQDPDDSDFSYETFIADVGALVMGSTTYRWVVDNHEWPYTLPSWVLSSRPQPPVAGADIRFASGSVADLHPELVAAAGGRNVWVVGGGDLAGQFADAGLLDEIVVSGVRCCRAATTWSCSPPAATPGSSAPATGWPDRCPLPHRSRRVVRLLINPQLVG